MLMSARVLCPLCSIVAFAKNGWAGRFADNIWPKAVGQLSGVQVWKQTFDRNMSSNSPQYVRGRKSAVSPARCHRVVLMQRSFPRAILHIVGFMERSSVIERL
jgi:hypothetical protein